jgi:hypothetical protein
MAFVIAAAKTRIADAVASHFRNPIGRSTRIHHRTLISGLAKRPTYSVQQYEVSGDQEIS